MEFGENGRIKQRFRKMCADHHFFKPTSDDIAASLIAISLIVYRTGMLADKCRYVVDILLDVRVRNVLP